MSEEPPAKKVRKGAKSCTECRQRKVRCVWPTEGASICQGCLARGRTCELQVYMTPVSEVVKSTSRSRLSYLERTVADLQHTVRNLEASLGGDSCYLDRQLQELQSGADIPSRFTNDDTDSELSDVSPTNPPGHLLQLFDNSLLVHSETATGSATPANHVHEHHNVQKMLALRRLIPSRTDMIKIAAHASSWLHMCNSLFPMVNSWKSGDQLLVQFDQLQGPRAELTEITALVLSVAITVQQAPIDAAGKTIMSTQEAAAYVSEVSDFVEHSILSDDVIAASLKGIEIALLFIRLQLGCARVKKLWLLLRRIIAIAEMSGLPRASMLRAARISDPTAKGLPPLSSQLDRKVEIWESICVLDRLTSMMWSLPLATSNYALPEHPVLDHASAVIPQAYLYRLVGVAHRILELDTTHATLSSMEAFNIALGMDQYLRSLSALTPKSWWKIDFPTLSVDAILQYWQSYLTVRAHLHLALSHAHDSEFAFCFNSCLRASRDVASRYLSLRPLLPIGFFANHVIDLQSFTATVFLLLACHRTSVEPIGTVQATESKSTHSLVDQVSRLMESLTNRGKTSFAHRAVDSIRALETLLNSPQTQEPTKVVMNLPLAGRIHVSRKAFSKPDSTMSIHQNTQPEVDSSVNDNVFRADDANNARGSTLSYSFEIPEDYAFLNDDILDTGQWLDWNNLDADV